MKVLLHTHQLARRIDLDSRNLKARLAALKIEPVGILCNGRALYDESVVAKIEAELLKTEEALEETK